MRRGALPLDFTDEEMKRLLGFLWPLTFAAGCYTFRPTTETTPVSGERVRLTLTDSGAVVLAAQLGPATEELTGHVVGHSNGAYLMSVLGTRRRGNLETDWRGEQVAVPRALVARTEVRRFSRNRTALATIGLIAVTLGARAAFWGPGGVFGGAPPGGGPTPR